MGHAQPSGVHHEANGANGVGVGDPMGLNLPELIPASLGPAMLADPPPFGDAAENERSRTRLGRSEVDEEIHARVPAHLMPDGGSQADDDFEDLFDVSKHLQDLLGEPVPDAEHPADAREAHRFRADLSEMQRQPIERDSYIQQYAMAQDRIIHARAAYCAGACRRARVAVD